MTTRYNLGYVWTISLVAAMGGLLFGYDWVVIGGAKPFFEKSFGLTTAAEVGWANSCALVGCLIGSLCHRSAQRPVWPEEAAARLGAALRGLVRADRVGRLVHGVRGVADGGRRGDWHGLEPVADVHRRDRAGAPARDAWLPSTS